MSSRSVVTKLQAIFIADLLIVAFAAGGYYYVQSLPKPLKKAEFQVTDLTIGPLEVGIGQTILISVNVTNMGEEAGNYVANLTINDVVKESKTVELLGGESQIVEFTATENNVGSFSVEVAGLTGTFTVSATPPPSTLRLSDLITNPYEAWVNETIKISVKATNIGDEPISYWLAFKVNDEVKGTKNIQLLGGETTTVESNVTESSEGTYTVNVAGLTGRFHIVPSGRHTLEVSAPYSGFGFVLDGKSYTTPYSELLAVGKHTVTVQDTFQTRKGGILKFLQWNDGDSSSTKTIDLQSWTLLVPSYQLISGIACCPSLYVWNGNEYVYRTEVSSGTGYLGILDYFQADGSIKFAYSDPWDYIKLDRSQIQPRNGYYDMILTQMSDEIFYMDAVKLFVVDHSRNVDVYSTQGTYIYNLDPNSKGKIYTVSKNPRPPISAIDEEGKNCLPQISMLDGICTAGHEFQWDIMTLDLGDLSNAKEIKLVVAGVVIYSSGEVQGAWAANFFSQPGVRPFPPPYMEVKDANGNWVPVPESMQFPLIDVTPDCFVVDLTGLFPTNDYSIRINSFFNTRFDYIGVDTTSQQNVIIHSINPASANFHSVFETNSGSSGNFTRYGDVTALMLEADDKYIVGRQGDEVSVKFRTSSIGPTPENMERDFFLYVSCWFKVKGLPYLSFTVDPLPFHAMSCFPYPSVESYPYDEEHLRYIYEYNTRRV